MGRIKLSTSAADFLPARKTLPALREASASCKGCELYKGASQTVFGEGPASARIMLVGTMPGDQEDKQGRPFVGPAGRLLDKAMNEAGLDRASVYITNAVKHFKFVKTGNYRLHRNPGAKEMRACRPWLDSEIRAVKPEIIVALGTLAGESLLDRKVVLRDERGGTLESIYGIRMILTIHPSALLRLRGAGGDFNTEYSRFAADLRRAAQELESMDKAA